MINLLEVFHSIGYIHRDIKPSNFVIGLDNDIHKVFLKDYGITKKYICNNKHIPFLKKPMVGTARFASVNSHLEREIRRRDDMESFVYILIYLAKGHLQVQLQSKYN